MKRSAILGVTGALATLSPIIAYAAPQNFEQFINLFTRFFTLAIPILFSAAFLAFFWGLTLYVFNQANDTKKEGARQIMLWGIIALFIMVSVWGIVRLLQETILGQTGGSSGSIRVQLPVNDIEGLQGCPGIIRTVNGQDVCTY